MSITKAWDWSKNSDGYWLIPSMESAFLAERWQSEGFADFLDLGCGLGRHSVYMARKGFHVASVDLSDYGVHYLNDWAAKEGLPIQTAVCDMLNLPFEDCRFDCMIAYNVIYHTDTAGFLKAVDEIRRVLKPGGEVFLTLLSKNTWSFQRAGQYKKIDGNTLLRDEDETEKNVPHFYADIKDIKDIKRFFADWTFASQPKEWCECNIERPEYYSKHWALLLRKQGEK